MDLKDEHLIENVTKHLNHQAQMTTEYLREHVDQFLVEVAAAKELADDIPTINDMITKAEHVFVTQVTMAHPTVSAIHLNHQYLGERFDMPAGKYRFVVAMFRVED